MEPPPRIDDSPIIGGAGSWIMRRSTVTAMTDRPAGLGVAVVFTWALAAQLATQGVAGLTGLLGQHGGAGALVWHLAAAAFLLAAGEGLRRGVPWVRVAVVAVTSAITLAGIVSVARLITGHGAHALVLPAIVEVTFAPFIAWRLSLPRTARWFATARGRGRAPRVSGAVGVSVLVVWSAAWGVLVAWSESL